MLNPLETTLVVAVVAIPSLFCLPGSAQRPIDWALRASAWLIASGLSLLIFRLRLPFDIPAAIVVTLLICRGARLLYDWRLSRPA